MPQRVKNSLKIEVLFNIYMQKLHFGFTSKIMFMFLGPKLFSPKAVEMGLMRYAKHGMLCRKRIGHEYRYYPNDNTYRAYCYYFGHAPAGVPVPLSVGLSYLQGGLGSSSSSFPPPPIWTPSSKEDSG
jgi:hypothetical protein